MTWMKKSYKDRPKPRAGKFQSRFWLPKDMDTEDASTVIVLTKGDPTCLWEHQVKVGGDWKHWHVCLRENKIEDRCPLCEHGEYKPYYGGAFTIIDRGGPNTDEKYVDQKRILFVKNTQLGRFELQASKRGGDLYLAEFSVCRTGSKTASAIGDFWDFTRKWKREEVEEEFSEQLDEDETFLDEFDWSKTFKPDSIEDLEAVVDLLPGTSKGGGARRSSSKARRRSSSSEDEDARAERKARRMSEEEEPPRRKKSKKKTKRSKDIKF